MPTQKELEYYLAQARRISEHREKGAEKEIRKQFKTLLQDVRHFISDEYAALAENDELTYAILQQKGDYARFLEEIELLVNNSSPAVQQEITNLVQRVYAISYQGMIEAVDKSTNSEELHEALKGVKGVTPEIVKRAVENPISGLTLADILEKNRKEIVYELKKQIGIGLTNGDRYSTMAKRIAEQLNMDYRKAITIARTESHRVREAGYHDSATELNTVLEGGTTAKRLQKTWKTMQDERVRKTSKANHRRLNGVSVPMDEEFDLGHGVKAKAPSQSGDPANDINCRCYLTYELVEVKTEKANTSSNPKSYGIGEIEKPVRPQKNDFANEDEYYEARDKYRASRDEYNKMLEEAVNKNMSREHIFKSQEQVKKWADDFGIKIYGDIGDVDLRAFDDVKPVIEEMFEKYPFLRGYKSVLDGEEVNIGFVLGRDYESGTIMSANGGIHFGNSFKDYEIATRMMLDQIADGFNVRGDGTVRLFFRHEIGHNVDDYIRFSILTDEYEYPEIGTPKLIVSGAKKRIEYENELRKLANCKGVSEYAMTHLEELFAEGFAEYESGSNSEFSIEFGKFLKKYLR